MITSSISTYDIMKDRITFNIERITEKQLQNTIFQNNLPTDDRSDIILEEAQGNNYSVVTKYTQWYYSGAKIMERTITFEPEGIKLDIKTFKI